MVLLMIPMVLIVQVAAGERPDQEGCSDHPLLTRMSDFYIVSCKKEVFAGYKFITDEGYVTVEGHHFFLEYWIQDGVEPPGFDQIRRNFINALRQIGGELLYEEYYSATVKVVSEGREVWIEVAPRAGAYNLTIIEKEEMVQEVVADAAALKSGIDRTGHVAVYGIYFDTDKAVVKPESEAALVQIAKLLTDDPDLNVYVVGHTDMTGGLDHNMDLSRARAEAVIEVLVSKRGIARDRLAPGGVGPLAPVASNDTDAGRALNRRVELVKR
jgi:outer membrane protein OmpA-like peptidoglycan-associated protein